MPQPNHTTLPVRRFVTDYSDAQKRQKFNRDMNERLAKAIQAGQIKIKRGTVNG